MDCIQISRLHQRQADLDQYYFLKRVLKRVQNFVHITLYYVDYGRHFFELLNQDG